MDCRSVTIFSYKLLEPNHFVPLETIPNGKIKQLTVQQQ